MIVDHIWSNLGGEDSVLENVVDPVDTNRQQIPQLHKSWLTDDEKEERAQQHINAEVHRRLEVERRVTPRQDIDVPDMNDQDSPATHVEDLPGRRRCL